MSKSHNEINQSDSGNFIFQDIADSVISITQFIGTEFEYKELQNRLKLQEKLFSLTPETETLERTKIASQITDLKNYIHGYEKNILSLAKTFTTTAELEKAEMPIEYYSCFISFTEKDDLFSEKLYNDMQKMGIRCWRWKEDAKWGKTLRKSIDEAVSIYDKLVIICSEDSLRAPAVLEEIEKALNKEDTQIKAGKDGEVLFPITIDSYIFDAWEHYLKDRILRKTIGDFKNWSSDSEKYNKSIQRLVKNLNKHA
jgi:hypothetical protein